MAKMTTRQQQIFKELFESFCKEKGYREDVFSGLDLGVQFDTESEGMVQSARVNMATDPSNADTLTIGGHVFKFLTTLIAADTTTQVKRGTSAAQTRTDFIDAINGVTNANVVAATTPHITAWNAAGYALAADLVDTSRIRVRRVSLDKPGVVSAAVAQTPVSIALLESLTNGADVWDCANMNESGVASGKHFVAGHVIVTAAMITAAKFHIELPFTPVAGTLQWDCYSSAGVKRACDEAVTVSGSTIKLTLAGGGSPNFQANDVFSFTIRG